MTVLSARSRSILAGLSDGRSVEQILARDLTLRYEDVATAAREALALSNARPAATSEERRRQHARAYEPWTETEEKQLTAMIGAGASIAEMASALARQPSAIRSRLARLGLDRIPSASG